jgi:transposase-like protein
MAMFGKIRRMYFRDGLSLSEIARRTSLSRNTVKKWVRTPTGEEPRYRRPGKAKRLSGYDAQLIRALEADGRDRNAARATLGEGLSVSAFPLDVPV